MELLKTVKRRTFWSEVVYYGLNIGLAAVLLLIAQTIRSPYPALALVLISKWRVIAVRPRFWWANIQANLVDIIVGLGVVGLMYSVHIGALPQAILAAFYAIWLVIIKPMSRRWQVTLQSGLAIFIGVTSLMTVSYEWPLFAVVLLMALIGYSAARHVFYSYDEEKIVLLSAVLGIVFAEFGWMAYFWNRSHSGTAAGGVPQVAIILLLVSFAAEAVYRSWRKHQKVLFVEVSGPLFLMIAITLTMLLFFNSITI